MRASFKYLTSLLFVAILVQVGVAAVALFKVIDLADANGSVTKDQIENGIDPHHMVGTIVAVLILLLIITAFALGMDPLTKKLTAGLLVLMILQFFFAWLGTESAWLGFLHGLNALAIYAVAALLAHRAWTRKTAESPGGGAV